MKKKNQTLINYCQKQMKIKNKNKLWNQLKFNLNKKHNPCLHLKIKKVRKIVKKKKKKQAQILFKMIVNQ